MTDTCNINAHYTNDPKVKRVLNPIAQGPQNIPQVHVYNDLDARKRLKSLDNDIFQLKKEEEKRTNKNFIKIFAGCVLSILAAIGLRRVFKKS